MVFTCSISLNSVSFVVFTEQTDSPLDKPHIYHKRLFRALIHLFSPWLTNCFAIDTFLHFGLSDAECTSSWVQQLITMPAPFEAIPVMIVAVVQHFIFPPKGPHLQFTPGQASSSSVPPCTEPVGGWKLSLYPFFPPCLNTPFMIEKKTQPLPPTVSSKLAGKTAHYFRPPPSPHPHTHTHIHSPAAQSKNVLLLKQEKTAFSATTGVCTWDKDVNEVATSGGCQLCMLLDTLVKKIAISPEYPILSNV